MLRMNSFRVSLLLIFVSLSSGRLFNRHHGGMIDTDLPCSSSVVRPCKVIASQLKDSQVCNSQRIIDIKRSRRYFHLTSLGGKKRIRFPLDSVPFLNQTMESVALHTALDQTDSRWFSQFMMFRKFFTKMEEQLKQVFAKNEFKESTDYIRAYSIHREIIQHLGAGSAFTNPALSPSFTDVIYNKEYRTDDIFVQTRLAGPCPFLIKLVTHHKKVGMEWTKLLKLLNPHFDFDASLQKAINEEGMTMKTAMDSNMLYVLYHEEMRGIPSTPDYFGKPLLNITSPIAIFGRTRRGDLKIVAIQMDDVPTSSVYTPDDDSWTWTEAKNLVNTVDTSVCQGVWHLSHIHLSGSTYCTIFRSHFGIHHPLHQVLRHHCEGTTPHIALSYQTLFAPHDIGQKIFSISNKGYAYLAQKGYKAFTYGMLDFENIMRKHGLDSYRLRYHPFRDDGKIIWSVFHQFSKQFTKMYYKSDRNVLEDKELQSFAAQVSIDGKGDSYGGKGNIVGFPQTFETKSQVEIFVRRLLWQVALHAVINYPLEPFSSFVPLAPTKLYTGTDKKNVNKMLSDSRTTIGSIVFATMLGNMRVNRIFDYYDKVNDGRLKRLVRKFHGRMHGCVQAILEKRNLNRKLKRMLGFQYLEPKWLTNSIHI